MDLDPLAGAFDSLPSPDHGVHTRCMYASVARTLFGAAPVVRLAGAEFVVKRRLGGGAMGVVYEVERPGSSGTLGLKLLHEAGSEQAFQLKREFRALSRLAHPHLVVLHELYADAAGAAFTMEHVRGVDFLAYVCPAGVLRLDRLHSVTLQLLDGTAWLHAAGIVHRDLKPSNVLVTEEGRAVLLDFGIALVGPERDISGTAHFMAPEQAAGRTVAASDLYALGVMLQLALRAQPAASDERSSRQYMTLERASALMTQPEPADRTSALALLRLLGGSPSSSLAARRPKTLVGRTEERTRFADFSQPPLTAPRLVHISAPAGQGKSALLDEFVKHFRSSGAMQKSLDNAKLKGVTVP